jgi:ABC-type Mn2+/Zn2+ transport system ATPase subunit
MLISARQHKVVLPEGELLQDSLTFSLDKGECLIVRGPNGSGKTTLIKQILASHKSQNSSSTLSVCSNRVEYLPQLIEKDFFIPMTLGEFLENSEVSECKERLLSLNQLQRLWNRASGGERQKALLTKSLSPYSDLYILDEPFNHLDQKSKIKLCQWIEELLARGASFVIVAHGTEKLLTTLKHVELNLVDVMAGDD